MNSPSMTVNPVSPVHPAAELMKPTTATAITAAAVANCPSMCPEAIAPPHDRPEPPDPVAAAPSRADSNASAPASDILIDFRSNSFLQSPSPSYPLLNRRNIILRFRERRNCLFFKTASARRYTRLTPVKRAVKLSSIFFRYAPRHRDGHRVERINAELPRCSRHELSQTGRALGQNAKDSNAFLPDHCSKSVGSMSCRWQSS